MGQVATLSIQGVANEVYALTADVMADARGYFAARVGTTAWDALSFINQQKHLVSAKRMLDRAVQWSGTKTVPAQASEWPRDNAVCFGENLGANQVPDRLVEGEFELALSLAEDEAVQDSPSAGDNVKKVRAGSASVEFFVPTQGSSTDTRFPQVVQELVGCLIENSTAGLGAPFASGVDPSVPDQSSHFCDPGESYNLNQGYP